jgi:hypothetical protein
MTGRRLLSADMLQIERQLRLIAILDSAERIGLMPLDLRSLHTLAYLTDALAPVWHLPVLDGQVLKRRDYPFFPALQRDIDRLVGCGVMKIDTFSYEGDDAGNGWWLDASYALNRAFADPILKEVCRYDGTERAYLFVREVVYAASGLGEEGIDQLSSADAAYSSPLVDFGGLVEVQNEHGQVNATAKIAMRFKQLTREKATLSDAEIIHLYVRHLYLRMNVA